MSLGAGATKGLELYDGEVKADISRGARVLPADKGEVQDLKAEIAAYKTETTAVINQLVGEVNSLTPVGALLPKIIR